MDQTRIQGKIKQIGNYILEVELGQGQFGKVFKAQDKTTKTYYAIKRIDKRKIESNPVLPRLLNTEIKIMQDIEHPNILHLFDYIESTAHYYLVLTFCNQGDMEHYMKTRGLKYFDEDEALVLLKQILNGFAELRRRKVLHRDFKLQNIFMNDDVLVIGDFGLAKQGVDTGSTMLGTPQTMAPELLFADVESTLVYDSKADIWSVGVVYYQLLFGDAPYSGMNMLELKRSMRERTGDKLIFLRPISEESKDVLRRMLTIDVAKRINWTELFNHKVFDRQAPVKPAVLSGMDKMMRSFSNPKGAPLDPSAQFAQNKRHAESIDRTPFISPEQMPTPTPVPAKKAEENTIDPKLEQQILQEMALREISFTYNHERNKIMFLVFSVKHLQWALTNPRFASYAEPFFQLSLLILKKARVLNDGLIHNLSQGNNIFKINEQFWRLYVASPHLQETQGLFMSLTALLQEYFEVVEFRIRENGFDSQKHKGFVYSPNPDLAQMDKVMLAEKSEVARIRSSDQDAMAEPSHAAKLACLDKLIETSIYSEQTLQYIKNVKGIQEKFRMERFYKTITQNQGVPFY